MKKISILVVLLFVAASLNAAIGWSGNIWPNSGTDQTNGSDITVYYQMWKDGTTGPAGPDPNLSATLYYKLSTQGTYQSVAMSYLGAVGNNDEYSGAIPNTFFYTGDVVNFYCEGYDNTDASYSYGTDQNMAGPFTDVAPGSYNIVAGLNQDVTVTFNVYLGYQEASSYAGGVSVQGSLLPLDWTPGSTLLTDVDVDLIYTCDVLFPAGTNPNLEFKFTKSADGSAWDWESLPNRPLTIDDSSPTQIIDPPLLFDAEGTLPVELSAFTAVYMNEFVTVSWQTATETDVIGYNIFRSEEDDFSTVQKVNTSIIPGHGTTTTPQSYEFTDVTADPYYTTYYYWLEVVNFGGTNNIYGSIEFEPVDVDQNGEMNIITSNLLPSFPNPVHVGQSVKFSFCLGGLEGTVRPVQLSIYNVLGQRIADVVNDERVVNNYTAEWNTENVGRGIYFYQLKTEDYQETKKLMID